MTHGKDNRNATNELSNEQLEQVAGGNRIDFITLLARQGLAPSNRPDPASLLLSDRLGQVITGQWNPTGDKGLDDALPA